MAAAKLKELDRSVRGGALSKDSLRIHRANPRLLTSTRNIRRRRRPMLLMSSIPKRIFCQVMSSLSSSESRHHKTLLAGSLFFASINHSFWSHRMRQVSNHSPSFVRSFVHSLEIGGLYLSANNINIYYVGFYSSLFVLLNFEDRDLTFLNV